MSPQTIESPTQGSRQRTRSCATALVCHRCDNSYPLESTVFSCPDCGKGLDIVYDYELAASHFKDFPSSERPQNIWHFEELLPIVDAGAQATRGPALGLHAADPRRPAGRGVGHRQPVPEGRLEQPPEPLLQGSRRVDVGRAAARARQDGDRLRVDGQRRHGRSFAGGEGGRGRLHRLPQPPRGDEGARVHGAGREGGAGGGQLRRSQPALRANSPNRRAWTSRTSRCARSTPRAQRRRLSRSSSSWTGPRRSTSSARRPAARFPRACTRG